MYINDMINQNYYLLMIFNSPESKARIGLQPASVRPPVYAFKHEYFRSQRIDCNQILFEASLGWGKGCNRFWARSDHNSSFHGNR